MLVPNHYEPGVSWGNFLNILVLHAGNVVLHKNGFSGKLLSRLSIVQLAEADPAATIVLLDLWPPCLPFRANFHATFA